MEWLSAWAVMTLDSLDVEPCRFESSRDVRSESGYVLRSLTLCLHIALVLYLTWKVALLMRDRQTEGDRQRER